MKIFKNISRIFSLEATAFACIAMMAMALMSCKDETSYADLLRDEEKACNWYLAQQRVVNEIPADGKFETGSDAPFYKIDEDGYIYMQVINPGDSERAKKDDIVYFRFKRRSIKDLYEGIDSPWTGNAENLVSSYGSTNFIYENLTLYSSYQWGSGIQEPLKWLGYNSEVNLVLRAYYGFYEEQSLCIPFIINVKYFKPEY